MKRFASLTLISAVILFAGCSSPPTLSLAVVQEEDHLAFRFETKNLNGIVGIRMWRADTKQVLWKVDLNYFRGSQLAYDGPVPLPASTKFFVQVEVQYDTMMTAASRGFYFAMTTDARGHVTDLSPLNSIGPDNWPKE